MEPGHAGRPISYVALGDSFTAGHDGEEGGRWPDRLAAGLGLEPEAGYRNLAREGATSEEVGGQVNDALQLEPDLITLICGANDVLLSLHPDPDAYAERLSGMFDRLRYARPEAAILTATAPERLRFMRLGRRTRSRVLESLHAFNRVTRSVAADHGVLCLEVAEHDGLDDPANFADDGLHASELGHRRATAEFALALREHFGIETSLARGEPA